MTRRPETDIARPVVAWLRADGWAVYQEVTHAGAVADIVAARDPLVWVIEVKAQLGLAVLGQAMHWLHRAHLVSVAGPALPVRAARVAFEALCYDRGIGVVLVDTRYERPLVNEQREPSLVRRIVPGLRASLRPEQQTHASAGNAEGARWTPWRATVRDLVETVQRRPGITLREALEGSRHHYSSSAVARASLARQIRSGLIDGLRLEQQGREVRVWPRERAA